MKNVMKYTLAAALGCFALAATGCGTIYSKQDFGSPRFHTIAEGSTKTEVLANLGLPNAVYRSDFRDGETREAFSYSYNEGKNVLGLYSELSREDTVVVFDSNDEVLHIGTVYVGEGMTIISPPFKDSTHPLSSDVLLFTPANYDYTTTLEQGN